MRRGKYKHGAASCKLAYSQALPAHIRGNVLEILNLETPLESRGKGYAKGLIADICLQADANRITLLAMPKPFGELGLTLTGLVSFYKKAGFFCIQDSPSLLMARPPLRK